MAMGRATRGVLPAALAAGVTLAHLLMAAFMRAPIVMPDEGGYLENARLLARGGPRPVTNYYPGLSVLIAPVWRFTLDALTVWRWTLVVNSVAAGLTALLVWILVGCLSPRPLSRWWRAGIAVAVSTYPALLLYSNLAMAESLFALVAT